MHSNRCMYVWHHADKSKRSMKIVLRNLVRVKEMPQPSSGEERVKSSNKRKGRTLALSLSEEENFSVSNFKNSSVRFLFYFQFFHQILSFNFYPKMCSHNSRRKRNSKK